jgi:hypothetical protein
MKITAQDIAVIITLVACIGSLILYARNKGVFKRSRIQKITVRVMAAVFIPLVIVNFFNNHAYQPLVSISETVVFVTLFVFSYQNYRRLQK